MPVLNLHFHTRLAVGNVFCQGLHILEAWHVGSIDVGAEGLLDESLERHHVQRVEGEIGLDVIGGVQHVSASLPRYKS